jgi:acyl carrier protein
MEKEDFKRLIVDFIQERNEEEKVEIKVDDNLIQKGLLDSFMMIELVMKLEAELNEPLDTDALTVEDISSVDALYNFFIVKNDA